MSKSIKQTEFPKSTSNESILDTPNKVNQIPELSRFVTSAKAAVAYLTEMVDLAMAGDLSQLEETLQAVTDGHGKISLNVFNPEVVVSMILEETE